MSNNKKESENASTTQSVQKKRKIVIYPEQLFDIKKSDDEDLKEAIELMEAMPGIGFEYAIGIAKYNRGKADHPLIK